jgi:hypothetical protein
MAQTDFRNGGRLASAHVNAQPAANIGDSLQAQQLPRDAIADFVLGAPNGTVVALHSCTSGSSSLGIGPGANTAALSPRSVMKSRRLMRHPYSPAADLRCEKSDNL